MAWWQSDAWGGVGAAVAACAAAVVLTACGGGENGGAAAKPEAGGGSAVAADEVTVTPSAVGGDIRAAAAAGEFGRPRFVDCAAAGRMGPGTVLGQVRTTAKPDRKAVTEVVAVLKAHGWREPAQTADPTGDAWVLEKERWSLSPMAGAMTKEQVLAAQPAVGLEENAEAVSGLFLSGVGRDCGAASASPSP